MTATTTIKKNSIVVATSSTPLTSAGIFDGTTYRVKSVGPTTLKVKGGTISILKCRFRLATKKEADAFKLASLLERTATLKEVIAEGYDPEPIEAVTEGKVNLIDVGRTHLKIVGDSVYFDLASNSSDVAKAALKEFNGKKVVITQTIRIAK